MKIKQKKRIPKPKEGFIPFKWKSKVFKKGQSDQYKGHLCPECGEFGFAGKGCYFTDPNAQAFYDTLGDGYEAFCSDYEGNMIKCHWSRMDQSVCMNCGVKLLHDWICDHEAESCTCSIFYNYYKPKSQHGLNRYL